jgi:hypothetical protein
MKYPIIFATVFAAGIVVHLLSVYTLGYFSSTSAFEEGLRTPSDKANSRLDKSIAKKIHDDVYNETLGFQEIFVISLADRSDKQDSISVQATLSNICITVVDGVVGKDVPAKAKPYGMDRTPPEVGCWRSHLNIMQHVVQHRLRSALIMEDDADWDVAIKAQMFQLALGSRWLLNNSAETTTSSHISPYGEGWDLLWIGHCSMQGDPADRRAWVIPRDPTVLPPGKRSEFFEPDMTPWESGPDADPQTRIVFVPGFGFCSTSWAVSLAGAEKILYRQSMSPFNDAVDMGVGAMCRDKTLNMSCIAPFPTIIGNSKPAGNTDRGSDIVVDIGKTSDRIREKPVSDKIMFSTLLNTERLLADNTEFESQYPNVTGQFMGLGDIASGVGHGEWLSKT